MRRICSSPPGNLLGTMRAGLQFTSVHWLSRGLADYNPRSASPSDVWANDSVYHNLPPEVVAKRQLRPLSGQNESLKAKQRKLSSQRREAACGWACPGAFPKPHTADFSVARSGGNVPAWLVFIFQATSERLFPVHPIAQEKGRIVT